MIGVDKNHLPYQSKITYPMIKYIRLCRNMSQESFGDVCRINQSTIAKLEKGEIQLSINYESKVLEGCRVLNIKNYELDAIKTLLSLKENK
jgi:transcriptional regulator with XRE-family HTH domain